MLYKPLTEEDRKMLVMETKRLHHMTTLYRTKRAITFLMKKDPSLVDVLFTTHGTLAPEIIIMHWMMNDKPVTGLMPFLLRWKKKSNELINEMKQTTCTSQVE